MDEESAQVFLPSRERCFERLRAEYITESMDQSSAAVFLEPLSDQDEETNISLYKNSSHPVIHHKL